MNYVDKTIPLPAYLAEDETLLALIDAATDFLGCDQVALPFIQAARQELEDRGTKVDKCAACGTRHWIEELDSKPTMTIWLRIINAVFGPGSMLQYASDRGYDFDRLECSECYGPGYSTH